MIYLRDKEIRIKHPDLMMDLHPDLKKEMFEVLKEGNLIFKIPNRFYTIGPDSLVSDKEDYKAYKIGFLYDAIKIIYPDFNKTVIHRIISENYHLWLSYRQFKTLLDLYYERKKDYFKEV